MSKFVKMSRIEWEKPVSRSTVTRRDVFVDAIKAGDPVSDIDGKDVYIANTAANITAIDDFISGKNNTATFSLDLKSGGTILSNKIGKSPIFGGAGVGGGSTGDTARFESLHCLYIAAVLGEGTRNEFSHFTYETLKKYQDKVKVSEPFEKYVAIDPSWHESSYMIAQELIKKKYVTRQHTLHRGDAVMDAIYKAKDKVRKLEGKPRLDSDKWNPGDIWAVKSRVDPKTIFAKAKTLNEVNMLILKHFLDKTIVGISLKKVGKNKKVKLSEYNIEEKILDTHRFSKVTLETAAGKGIFSSKYGFFYFDGAKKADMRAPNLYSALNMELQGSGARAGRVGYGQLMYSVATHLKTVLPANKDLVSQAKLMEKEKSPSKLSKDFYKLVKKIHPQIKEDEFMIELQTKRGDAIHALLAAAHIGAALMSASRTQRDAFTSEVVNVMAAKTNDSSAYVKAEQA